MKSKTGAEYIHVVLVTVMAVYQRYPPNYTVRTDYSRAFNVDCSTNGEMEKRSQHPFMFELCMTQKLENYNENDKRNDLSDMNHVMPEERSEWEYSDMLQ